MLASFLGLFLLVAVGTAVRKAPSINTGEYNPAVDTSFCMIKCGRNKAGIDRTKSQLHVACDCYSQSMGDCKDVDEGLIPDLRLYMTIEHNKLRNKVALGEYYNVSGLPPASDMNAIGYDLSLEYSASCSANKCQRGLDLCIKMSTFKYVAQNDYTFFVPSGKMNSSVTAQRAVNYWFKRGRFSQPASAIIAQYKEGIWEMSAAMLWSSLESIGCAARQLKNKLVLVVCNYGGNRNINKVGRRVYREGAHATQCYKRGGHDDEFKGLCGTVPDVPIAPLVRGGGEPFVEISASGKFGTPVLNKQNRVCENLFVGVLVLLLAWHF